MTLISSPIPNLINGVSQQAPSIRLSSQADVVENCFPSIVEGLKKRPPTHHISKLINGVLGDNFVHDINRDSTEQYVAIVTTSSIRVFDLTGTEKTVTTPNGLTYLDTTTPSTDLRALTIADYTFFLNRSKKPLMATTLSAHSQGCALVHVKQGNYSQNYKISVDGVVHATKTTSASDPVDIRTDKIASDLAASLTTSLGAGWTITRQSYSISIKKDDGTDFRVEVEDSFGGNALKAVKDKVQRFSDLPVIATKDFIVEVVGEASSNFDNYFVKFTPNNATSTFDAGVWEETLAPSIEYDLDASMMPHVLVREADGTFTFREALWDGRQVGDLVSAPDPSFIGASLNDIFFFKNRLGFLADQNVIMSQAGEFFAFLPSTVTSILDNAPIDVSAAHTKVSILQHAVPFNGRLLLFSDQTQFVLEGGDLLTPKTAEITQTTEFESTHKAKPVGIGRVAYFGVNRGGYAGLREYFVGDDGVSMDAEDVTGHVPKYLAGNLTALEASSNEDILVATTDADQHIIYPYKYYWVKDEKLQSAWTKWTYHATSKVLRTFFIETTLYLVLQHGDGVFLERMEIEPAHIDEHTDLYGTGYVTHLDRRLDDTQLLSTSYDAVSNTTTLNLPYNVEGALQVVTRATSTSAGGRVLATMEETTSSLKVSGDQTSTALWVGQKYTQRYRFGTPTMKEQAKGGGVSSVDAGRLQLRNWSIKYEDSGFFEAHVTPLMRDTFVYTYTGRILGQGQNILGSTSISSGTYSFPVMSRNDRVVVELVNDTFLPATFISAEWEGQYTSRSQRV